MPRSSAATKVRQAEAVEPLDLADKVDLSREVPIDLTAEVGSVVDDSALGLLKRLIELSEGHSELLGRITEAVEQIVDVIMAIEPGMKGSRS